MAARFFDDYTNEVASGGDIINIPEMSNAFTATAVTATSGRTSYTEVSESDHKITLDQWYYTAYPMTDLQKAQYSNKYKLFTEYSNKMGYELAKQYDTAILALGASVTATVGDSGTNINETAITNAIALMESNSVPLDESAFIMHPYAYWKEIAHIDGLTDASEYGKNFGGKDLMPHSTLYGIPVFISSNVPAGTSGTEGGHRNLLIHNRSFAHARANLGESSNRGIRFQTKESSEHLRDKMIADIAYGVTCATATSGVRMISSN